MVRMVQWGSGSVSASVASQMTSAGVSNPSSSSSSSSSSSGGSSSYSASSSNSSTTYHAGGGVASVTFSPSTSSGSSGGGGSSAPQMTSGSSDIAPQQLAPIRSIDYVDSSGAGAGAISVSGQLVGGSTTSGSGGKVLSTTFNKPTTESLTGARVTEKTNRLAPKSFSSEAPNFDDDYNRMTRREKAQEVVLRYKDQSFGSRYKEKTTGKWYSKFNIFGGFGAGISPIVSAFGTNREGDKVVNDPKYSVGGTGVFDTSTGEYNQPTTTAFDLQTQKNFADYDSSDISSIRIATTNELNQTGITDKYKTQATDRQSYYQGKVDSGELDAKTAQSNLDTELGVINTKYQSEYQGKFQELAQPRIERYNKNASANARLNELTAPKTVGSIGSSALIAGSIVASGGGSVVLMGATSVGFGANAVQSMYNQGVAVDNKDLGGFALATGSFALSTYAAGRLGAGAVTQFRVNTLMKGGNLSSQQQPFTRRFISGNKAIDIGDSYYTKSYGSSRTVSYAESTLGKNNLYTTKGFNYKTTVVKDAWSGKNIHFQQGTSFTGTGKLYPTSASGQTPSFFKLNEQSYNLQAFGNRMDITTSSATKTYGGTSSSVIKNADLRLSQSGKFGGFYAKEEVTRFSGTNYYKDVSQTRTGFSFRKDSSSAIKIYQSKAPTKFYEGMEVGGTNAQNFGGGQTQTFSSGGGGNQVYTLKLAPQTQALATTSQIGNLPAVGSSFGGGQLSVGGLALANIAGVGALGLQNISSTGNIGVGKITGTLAPPQLLSKIGTTSVVAQAQPQSITSGSASKLISLSGIGSAITGIGSGVTAFGLKPLGFGFPRIGGGVGNPRSRKIKTKAKYGYTPDYTSLVTGRKGKATTAQFGGKFAGFEARPITTAWVSKLGIGGSLFKRRKKKKKK